MAKGTTSRSGGQTTIRSSGPMETGAITGKLRDAGTSYTVVRGGQKAETFVPATTAPRNPGRGAPGRSPGSPAGPSRVTYVEGPGGYTQAVDTLPVTGYTMGGGYGALPPPGYSNPVFQDGEFRYLTSDYLHPDGGVLRERQNMSVELPEAMGLLEHWNMNPDYWGGQFSQFARENPVITGAGAVVGGALAYRTVRGVFSSPRTTFSPVINVSAPAFTRPAGASAPRRGGGAGALPGRTPFDVIY